VAESCTVEVAAICTGSDLIIETRPGSALTALRRLAGLVCASSFVAVFPVLATIALRRLA